MKQKNGFFSISIVYSFFIVFLLMLALMMATYVNNRTKFNIYKTDIKKKSINQSKLTDYLISLDEERTDFNKDSNNNYRFQGEDPNNYLDFAGQKWRIVVVENNTRLNGESGKYYTKIVLNDNSVTSKFSSMSPYLYNNNSEIYKELKNMYENKEINKEEEGIYNAKWYYKQTQYCMDFTNACNPPNVYEAEKGGTSTQSYWGTLSISDYLYGVQSRNLNSGNIEDYFKNNWLFNNYKGWILNYYYTTSVFVISGEDLSASNSVNSNKTNLSLYLNSDVVYVGGDGSSSNPFKIVY